METVCQALPHHLQLIEDTLNGAARVQQHAKENPILNNPYSEPAFYYSTNDAGELDYQSVVEGRRPFVPDIPPVPVKQGPQKSLIGLEASAQAFQSHVNYVVADTESWEQTAAKTLEELEGVLSYVKNAYIGFTIPYVAEGKREARYYPDFIARCRTASGRDHQPHHRDHRHEQGQGR